MSDTKSLVSGCLSMILLAAKTVISPLILAHNHLLHKAQESVNIFEESTPFETFLGRGFACLGNLATWLVGIGCNAMSLLIGKEEKKRKKKTGGYQQKKGVRIRLCD